MNNNISFLIARVTLAIEEANSATILRKGMSIKIYIIIY